MFETLLSQIEQKPKPTIASDHCPNGDSPETPRLLSMAPSTPPNPNNLVPLRRVTSLRLIPWVRVAQRLVIFQSPAALVFSGSWIEPVGVRTKNLSL
ncbi:uncharacterized protein ATNIH1004_004844 [Aspergillus tanneri]|uniref:Uncharacterized protein n=1 Tax=Aspergillus tanneri TaxID=1220188 RepID=A0A5M9MUA8_9EURO|nr:uncharacterized protein ATNIH1004_004844 [Aspergillus tanneri]KAA8648954.1 hypothetical protein ATNIH1004_004844 [Aspergillus tanneri]